MIVLKRFTFYASLIFLISSCNHQSDNDKLDSGVDINKILSFKHFSCDSTRIVDNKLKLFFKDDMDFFDPVQSEQRCVYALSSVGFSSNISDTVFFYFSMQNRDDGDMEISTSLKYLKQARSIYQDSVLLQVMDMIMKLDADTTYNHVLGGMNAEFAYFTYGDKAVDEAFFGVNSLNVIYSYRQECTENRYGPGHFIIDKYKTKIEDYKPNDKIIAEKILDLIICDDK